MGTTARLASVATPEISEIALVRPSLLAMLKRLANPSRGPSARIRGGVHSSLMRPYVALSLAAHHPGNIGHCCCHAVILLS